jgi:ABC-2 type transport system ATP-binding protein
MPTSLNVVAYGSGPFSPAAFIEPASKLHGTASEWSPRPEGRSCEYAPRLRERRCLEQRLADDAAQLGWPREVERHNATAGRLAALLDQLAQYETDPSDQVVPEPTAARICPAGLTLTLRQPSMLAAMSVPPATDQFHGSAIHVQGLEKSYKELRVLRGVDFVVARGSIFALLGANGAGKTTVVRILSTLLKADTGTARVNGFDVATQAADVRESISLTGQFAAVDEILSGRENLVLVARLRHLKDPGAIADDLLRRFSLTEAGSRRVATYSGGMRRRLDIAMSLIGSPPVIFLDEPTAGLDPQARIEVWQAVKELAEGGTTVLLTTQYLDEAEQLADRIAILHQGRIIVNGTLAELKALLPPATVEYVEKQPSLEDVFLAVIGEDDEDRDADTGSPAHRTGSDMK